MGWWARVWGMPGVEDRLRTLSGRIDDVESDLRRVRVEWRDVLDRLDRMAGRLRKRLEREAAAAVEEQPTVEEQPESEFDREMRLRRGARRERMNGHDGE